MLPTLLLILAGWFLVSLLFGAALRISMRRLKGGRAEVAPRPGWTMTPTGLVVRPATVPVSRSRRR